MDLFYYDTKDSQFKSVGYVSNLDLEADEEDEEKVHKLSEPISIPFEVEILDSDGKNAIRKIIAGGDRGMYNGLTLKEEDYLSPANAWL